MTDWNTPFALAAGWAFMIACLHTVVGSHTDVRPLLASDLREPAKSTVFYCWHIVTLLLVALAAAFAWSAAPGAPPLAAGVATVAAAVLAGWGLACGLLRGRSLIKELPQWLLFAVLGGLGAWGLTGS